MTLLSDAPACRTSPHVRFVRSRHRRRLERAGWRTLLTYRENQVRDADSRLIGVDRCWVAELEHSTGTVVTVEAVTASAAWRVAMETLARRGVGQAN